MIQSSNSGDLLTRAGDDDCFLSTGTQSVGASMRGRSSPTEDEFATTRGVVGSAAVPVPLLLSYGEFPVNFGRYTILDVLGEGEMGSVFLARDTQLNRQVAIKMSKLDNNPEATKRFEREARLMSNVRHPNVCPVYDVGKHDGIPFFTMAHIEGETLTQYLVQRSRLSNHQVAMLVRKLALALDAAHQTSAIHRDLKPSNIIIDTAGEPVITDFGLAKSETDSIFTKDGVMLGTPAYMPPEQAMGRSRLVGPASDIYSLGVVMYEMLTGRIPFEGKLVAVLKQIMVDEPPPPSQFMLACDQELEAICLNAMAKTVEHRFASALAFADALYDYLSTKQLEPGVQFCQC